METRLPFPVQQPGRRTGRRSTRRLPAGQAAHRSYRRPPHRLDARTREIGLAGVASARLVLAACRSDTGGLPGSTDRDPTGNDDPAGAVPVGGANRTLPEAA